MFYALDHGLADSLVYRAWPYLLVMLVVLAIAARARRLDVLTIALAGSIVLYIIPLALFSPAIDFRYVHWPILACLLLPAILLAKRKPTEAGAAGNPPGATSPATSDRG